MGRAQHRRVGAYTTYTVLQPHAEALEAALIAEYHFDVIAAFWQGEISIRQVRVLKEHLPDGSAVHRAGLDGQYWTNNEALLWGLWHKLDWLDQRLVWTKRMKPKWPKFKAFPWAKSGAVIGDRGSASNEAAIRYLESIAPPKKSKGGGPHG
ncbi:hypothetical protein CH274_13195 [Rhodococcus sp. 06-418-5]|uniref:hypothetical protein n=1 Tax=Rhodococcus sp. 06-418-5 TaxID=2022507 RepID=UPI000B9B0693|nr:hypothetical protein [Rhodococcus sp. 06-418-5]OZC80187.1 hypothetical protein CH274_13195 [Rhodococcus sp. 06-418-5]